MIGYPALAPMSREFPWKLVVFDCDGTLVDSQHSIVQTMAAAFEAAGLAAPSAASVRRLVGLNLDVAMAHLLAERPDDALPLSPAEAAAQLAGHYRDQFHRSRLAARHGEPLYPGAREALAALLDQQALLGIATGKGRRGLLATLEQHDILQHFVTLQTADGHPGKPHPSMLLRAMDEAGVHPEETVLVGDTAYDMEMAANAGSTAVGVSWGYHESEALHAAGAACVIDSFADLLSALSLIERTER